MKSLKQKGDRTSWRIFFEETQWGQTKPQSEDTIPAPPSAAEAVPTAKAAKPKKKANNKNEWPTQPVFGDEANIRTDNFDVEELEKFRKKNAEQQIARTRRYPDGI